MSTQDDPIAKVVAAARQEHLDSLARVLAEMGHTFGMPTNDSIEHQIAQMEAFVRGRCAWLHGWYEATKSRNSRDAESGP